MNRCDWILLSLSLSHSSFSVSLNKYKNHCFPISLFLCTNLSKLLRRTSNFIGFVFLMELVKSIEISAQIYIKTIEKSFTAEQQAQINLSYLRVVESGITTLKIAKC